MLYDGRLTMGVFKVVFGFVEDGVDKCVLGFGKWYGGYNVILSVCC